MPDNIEPFTVTIANNVCERLHTENKTITIATGTVPMVISFDVVSDDGVFEEKQKGFDESIMGASKQCGSAALSSHNVGTYGSNIQNEKITTATQLRDRHGRRLYELPRWRHLTSGISTQPIIIVHVILR